MAEGFKALPAAHLEEINLEVRGFESDIKHINQDNIKFYVDLKNLTEGNSNLPLQMRPIEGISLIKIDPDSLTVNILKE